MNTHGDGCKCEVCRLSELDKGTEWELDGNMLSVNDADGDDDDDDGMAGVPSTVGLLSEEEDETIENILDAVGGFLSRDEIEDLLVIVNLKDGEQMLLTTFTRNDIIMGCLSIAAHNWHASQVQAQNYDEEEHGQ